MLGRSHPYTPAALPGFILQNNSFKKIPKQKIFKLNFVLGKFQENKLSNRSIVVNKRGLINTV